MNTGKRYRDRCFICVSRAQREVAPWSTNECPHEAAVTEEMDRAIRGAIVCQKNRGCYPQCQRRNGWSACSVRRTFDCEKGGGFADRARHR